MSHRGRTLAAALALIFAPTAALADNVFVVDANYSTVTQAVVGRLQAKGHTVTTGGPPSSLTGYQQVWDLRYPTALTSSETSLYTGFITNGGFAYFTTENPGCCTARNNSVASLIMGLGGGNTVIGGANGMTANVSSWVNNTYITPGITINFAAISAITNSQGIPLFEDSSGKIQAMSWIGRAGALGSGVTGTIITVSDINWLDSSRFVVGGTSAQQQNVQALDDIITGIVAGTVGGTISANGNGAAASNGAAQQQQQNQAPTVVSTSVANQVTTSTSNSSTSSTAQVTYSVSNLDGNGYGTVQNYTDTVVVTTPVTTTTTTTTPVTTTTWSDGSTTTSNGTPVVTTSSSNGTPSSQVTSTVLNYTAVSAPVTTTSSSVSNTTGTRTVTRTVTDTDSDGNPRVRTYTDTVLDTTPVTTVVTTVTPTTTTTYANGTVTVSEGTATSTSSSSNGTTTSAVTSTALDSTAITRPSVAYATVASGAPTVTNTPTFTATENSGKQKVHVDMKTSVTTPLLTTVTTTPVTTTTDSNGNDTITYGTPVDTYVASTRYDEYHTYRDLYGRVDQLETLDGISSSLNGLLDHEPMTNHKKRFRVFENTRFAQSYNSDGYNASSRILGGGFEYDLTKGWTVGAQYNDLYTEMLGVDSISHLKRQHVGVLNSFHGRDVALVTNAGWSQDQYDYARTVEWVFGNWGKTEGQQWWVHNRLYVNNSGWIKPYLGYTVSNVKRNAYAETGSPESARVVDTFNQTTHVGEAGLKLETRFGGKKRDVFGISVDGSYSTDNSYGVTGSLDYKEVLFVEGSYGVADGVTTNSIAGKVKFRF